jgi:hypothetical protein
VRTAGSDWLRKHKLANMTLEQRELIVIKKESIQEHANM